MENLELQFPDGRTVAVLFVERVPFEPAAYCYDEGLIVVERYDSKVSYFISTIDGQVYAQSADDPESHTEFLAGVSAPVISEYVARRDAQIESAYAGQED